MYRCIQQLKNCDILLTFSSLLFYSAPLRVSSSKMLESMSTKLLVA